MVREMSFGKQLMDQANLFCEILPRGVTVVIQIVDCGSVGLASTAGRNQRSTGAARPLRLRFAELGCTLTDSVAGPALCYLV